jgi:1-phosphofructokinase family hexose kinase
VNLAVGLTPAWQQILVFDKFQVDAVNRAREAHWCASGKVLNAGIALHRLGGPSKTIALVGGPPLEHIAREFDELGVPHQWVVSATPTRVCTTILDRGGSGKRLVMTELVENARSVFPGEVEDFLRIYEKEARNVKVAVLTGSLPAGAPASFYRDAIAVTRGQVILDARGEELRQALELEPLVVKPNREELGRTVGREIHGDADLARAMKEILRLGAVWVVVSQGKGAVWIASRAGMFHAIQPPVVEPVNPIGCGDCLAAGIAWGIADGRPVLDSVRLGVAAAVQNLQDILPARVDLPAVEAIAAKLKVERLH